MSKRVLDAVLRLGPRLPELLSAIPEDERPSPERAHHVAVVLADRFREERGFVDETVGQIAKVSTFGERGVRRSLDASEIIGVWIRVEGHRGGSVRRRGTRRVPGPLLVEELGPADRTELGLNYGSELGPADRTELRIDGHGTPSGNSANSDRYGRELRPVDRSTPLTSPLHPRGVNTSANENTTESEDGDEGEPVAMPEAVRKLLDGLGAYRPPYPTREDGRTR